ncbi:MAG: sensor histidine kinase [Microbacterium sp.]
MARNRAGLQSWWWDLTVALSLVVGGLWATFDSQPLTALPSAWWVCALLLYAVAYVLLARPALLHPEGSRRGVVFVLVAAIALGVGTASAPMLATTQAITHPLVWMLSAGLWQAITASAGIALAVGLGTAASSGGAPQGWATGGITAGLSLGFAIGMGLWITRIWEHGDENARLVTQLTEAQDQVAALGRDRGAVEERERLARDIHDTLAQTLAGLVLVAERAGRQSHAGQADAAAASIATVESDAREALREARALVAQTAAVPSEPAFGQAVDKLVARFREEVGLSIDLDADGGAESLDRESQVVLLRCLQEALSNVRKHAGARRVAVTVRTDAEGVALEVSDDGVGWDPAESRSGFGLDGMTERAALAGGAVQVVSGRGEGATVTVTLPVGGRVAVHPGASAGRGDAS